MSIISAIVNLPIPLLNHWVYWIILLAAIFESNPLTGLFVPGATIAILGGFFAKLGIVDLGDVIFIAVFGAILGDLLGYLLGRKFGHNLLLKYGKYIMFKDKYYKKIKKIVTNHTGKAIILGRFNSLTRAFAPFIAGTSEIPILKFLFYNIIGGLLWGIFFVLVGYIFGASYQIVSKYIGISAVILLVLVIVFSYLYKFIRNNKIRINNNFIYIAIVNIFSLYLFSNLLEGILNRESIYALDLIISQKVPLLWNSILNKLVILITNWMSIGLILIAIFIFGLLAYKKKKEYSWILLGSLLFGFVTEDIIKNVVQRIRPVNQLIIDTDYSFPSGHATMAAILFVFLIYIYKDEIKNLTLKWCFIFINLALILIVGFCRIYVNIHWFSDIIAGYSIGLFWLTLFILIFKIAPLKKLLSSYYDKVLEAINNLLRR